MDEADMVKELQERGYRVSKPKPKVEEKFEPFKAIEFERSHLHGGPREIRVVKETPKFAFVEGEYDAEKVEKDNIYKHDPEVIKLFDDANEKARELREQMDKVEQEARQEIERKLKPVYPEDGVKFECELCFKRYSESKAIDENFVCPTCGGYLKKGVG